MRSVAKYVNGDMVVFKLVKGSPVTYNGIITDSWTSKITNHRHIYSISCLNFGMNSYSISEEYIVKKLS